MSNGMKVKLVYKGGPGSGHHGHSGRPGKRGGSMPGGGGSGGGKGTEASNKKVANVPAKLKGIFPEKAPENFLAVGAAKDSIVQALGKHKSAPQRNMAGPSHTEVKLNAKGRKVLQYAYENRLTSKWDEDRVKRALDTGKISDTALYTEVSNVWNSIYE